MSSVSDTINTIINAASMIDRGFTVTITVQPHNWDGGYEDDYEEDEDDMSDVSDETIENIKEFAHVFDDTMFNSAKGEILDHYANLVKEKMDNGESLAHIMRNIEDSTQEFFKGIDKMVCKENGESWPKVGDLVWYKTKKLNYRCGHVKIVCHNTIQLEDMVTLERKDCMKTPFEVGEQVWFIITGKPECGIVEAINSDNARLHVKRSIMQLPYTRLFDSLDDLLDYLRTSAYE